MRLNGVLPIMLGAILKVWKLGRRVSVAWGVVSAVLIVVQGIRRGVAEAKEQEEAGKKPTRKQVPRRD